MAEMTEEQRRDHVAQANFARDQLLDLCARMEGDVGVPSPAIQAGLLAVMVGYLIHLDGPAESAEWLRAVADGLERGEHKAPSRGLH